MGSLLEEVHLEFERSALVEILGANRLEADLIMPKDPSGVVILVHGSRSSRLSPRNRFVARVLRERGLGTLLIDIETPEERALGSDLGRSPIDLEEMASRIRCATRWLRYQPDVTGLPIGYLGAGTGAGAVFMAAADHRDQVKAIVCRGGKLEPALSHLPRVETPSLLIVGARDVPLVQENHNAIDRLGTKDSRLEVIPGARHLFEEPGALTAVAMHSASWFARFLTGVPAKAAVQMGIWIA